MKDSLANAQRAQLHPARRLPMRAVAFIALLDLTARAAVPASLLALAEQRNELAVVAALAVNVLAVLRGLVSGRLVERTLELGWKAFVAAARRHPVTMLRTRGADHSAPMFVEATHRTAMTLAQVLPRLLADVVGLLGSAVAVVWLLGVWWLLAGGVAVLVAVPPLVWVQRRLRRHEARSFEALGELSLDVSALLDAAAELRAHGRESSFARALARRVADMAQAMRRAHTLSSLLSLLPLGVALVAALVPLRQQGWLSGQLLAMAQAGVLGATSVGFGISLVRSLEAWGRAAPQRELFARFIHAPGMHQPAPDRAVAPDRRGWRGELRLDQLSVRHGEGARRTPAPTSYRWQDGQGLALLGPNGAGKSSLVLVLLGLLEPDTGTLTLAGEPLDAARRAALTPHVSYLPQRPFVEPSRSVGWHLRLALGDDIDEQALQQGLTASGLWPLLERRAKRRGVAPLALSASELSGGEQQRMQLARAFVPTKNKAQRLVILDEPEAALDAAGRKQLASELAQLAQRARVLLIAHDPAVVPASFATLSCESE